MTLKRVKSFLIQQDAQMLLALMDKKSIQTPLLDSKQIIRPETSIAENSLFTGAVHEPSMVSEIKKEILSSHRIDFLVSFINQSVNGGNVLFFVREYKMEASLTLPYTCIGLADYQSHYGSAPISIVWKMKEPLPGFVMQKTAKV